MGNVNVYFCEKHGSNKLLFYCLACDELVCRDCKLSVHEGHPTVDIVDAVQEAKQELTDRLNSVENCASTLQEKLKDVREKQAILDDHHNTILSALLKQNLLLKQWVNEAFEREHDALLAVMADINLPLQQLASELKGKIQETQRIGEQLQATLTKDQGKPILTLRKQLRSGAGSENHLKQMIAELPDVPDRSVVVACEHDPTQQQLLFTTDDQCVPMTLQGAICKFLPKLKLQSVPVEVNVVNYFSFNADDVVVEVSSICPREDGKVWVAVQTAKKGACSWMGLFSSEGNMEWKTEVTGRVSIARSEEEWALVVGPEFGVALVKPDQLIKINPKQTIDRRNELETFHTVTKLETRTALAASAQGVFQVSFSQTEGLELEVHTMRHLKTIVPIAADVSHDGQFLAIVQEVDDRVLLFNRNLGFFLSFFSDHPDKTYIGVQPFKPRDLCFFRIDGLERLLVASSVGQAIHVLRFKGTCVLLHTLGQDLPLLKAPTALSPDKAGRLWIGCQNGDVLLLEPKEREKIAHQPDLRISQAAAQPSTPGVSQEHTQ